MALKLLTAPTAEPVTLADAKLHCRIDDTAQDAWLTVAIAAARRHAEMVTRRALVTQQWKVVLDQFPRPGMNISNANWYGPQWGITPGPLSVSSPEGRTGYELFLPMPPLQSVDSISYYDQATGVLTLLDPSQYIVDDVSEPARITPAYGTSWPATQNRINAVEVTFTCGFGAPSDVPEGIQNWVLIRVGTLYENREEVALMNRGKIEPLPYVDLLLDPYRVVSF